MFIGAGGSSTGSSTSSKSAQSGNSSAPKPIQPPPAPTNPNFHFSHLATSTSATLSPTAQSLIHANGNFGPLSTKQLNQYWTAQGKVTKLANGGESVDLGNGVTRIQNADGKSASLYGIKDGNGNNVIYARDGKNEWWNIDTNQAGNKIANDAYNGYLSSKGKPLSQDTITSNGKPVDVTQYPPGTGGAQDTMLKFSSGKTIQVISDSPLSTDQVSNLASGITSSPDKTFALTDRIQVFNKLGDVKGSTGASEDISGLAGRGNTISISTNSLSNPNSAAFVLHHEAGHVLDYSQAKNLSETATDSNGNKLFGEGNLKKGDFVSEYASRNPLEDFAETHRETVDLSNQFTKANPGQNFFDLSPAERDAFIESKMPTASPLLKEKINYVSDLYKNDPTLIPEATLPTESSANGNTGTGGAGTTDSPGTSGDTVPAGDVSPPDPAGGVGEATGSASTLGSIVTKGGGVLSIAGGGFQFYSGLQELNHGNKIDGGADVASGTANVIGGAGLLAGSEFGPAGIAVGAGINGGKDIYDGIRTGNNGKVAAGGAEVAGAAALGVGVGLEAAGAAADATVLGAPVGLALNIAGGLLIGGAAIYENRKAIGHFFTNSVPHFFGSVGSGIVNGAEDVGSGIANGAKDAWNTVTSWF